MFIGGSWQSGSSSTVLPDVDPYTGEALVQFRLADVGDVNVAYSVAEAAQPAWATAPPQERRDVVDRAAHIVELRKAEIVEWLVRESGSTRAKAEVEWRMLHLGMFEASSYPFHVAGRILPASVPYKESRVYRVPAGVVGVISPWNFPIHLSNRSVAPALAVGNAVVLKPASDTPVTGAVLLAKIFEEAGLPDGLLNVVIGSGKEVGDAFIDHPIPRVLSFTGSTAVGRTIAEHAGRQIKRVCLELGGNGPFIVFADADLDRAVHAAVAGKFLHQGQICIAINRILVDARIHEDFLGRFLERVAALRTGDPAHPETAIGPIINRKQLDAIAKKVEGSIAKGARVAYRGEASSPSGLVMAPVVLTEVTPDMPTACEEVFGPVASILRFQDEAEAVQLANDTEYGLSSAVFTRDVERGVQVAKRIQAGMTHVNDWPIDDEPNTAFGGEKASGLGRFGGEWALEEFTTDHWISVQDRPRRYPI
jgi:aldehyde dehydrogenase (NAD+)